MAKSNGNRKQDPGWQKQQQRQHHETRRTIDIVLLGDSDIAFWPSKVYPSAVPTTTASAAAAAAAAALSDSTRTDDDATSSSIHYDMNVIKKTGIPGTTLHDVVDQLPNVLEKLKAHNSSEANASSQAQGEAAKTTTTPTTTTTVFVVCAGENDIGNGIPLEQTIVSLQKLLSLILGNVSGRQTDEQEEKQDTETTITMSSESTFVIFLGPKFEPWMDESSSGDSLHHKKKYSAMSRAMERCCEDFNNGKKKNSSSKAVVATTTNGACSSFVNCLTMFCGKSGEQPGAVLGGRAEAEHKYFVSDHLHLNDEGYRVWKERVEHIIDDLVLSDQL